jgi:hypothetical protein
MSRKLELSWKDLNTVAHFYEYYGVYFVQLSATTVELPDHTR